jgi:cation:H+ antiporter
MPELIIFAISITAVIIGADWLGNSATHIAKRFSLPKVIIGATIVSLATTLPEIVIAGVSGWEGSPEVGLGTVFGSPLVNIGLIFGIFLLLSKPSFDKAYYLRTVKFFVLTLFLVLILSFGGNVSPVSGFILIFFGVIYLVIQTMIGKQEESLLEQIENRFENLKDFFTQRENYHQIFYLIIGSILLVFGAYFLVGSAVSLAEILSVPQVVIGFVIIAFGTSIPELFTTLNSIIKNRVGIGAGNLFGASVLDLTFALGLGSIFNGSNLPSTDIYLAIASLAIISLISLFYVLERVSPRILGSTLIIIYVVALISFSNL